MNFTKTHNEYEEISLSIIIQIKKPKRNILPQIKYETSFLDDEGGGTYTGIVILFCAPFVICIIIILLICGGACYECYNKKKEEKRIEMKLLGRKEIIERSRELFPLIQKNYKLIENVCFICAKNDNCPLFSDENIDISSHSMDCIKDINNENFFTFLEYITPIECPHFYHDDCLKEKNIKKNKKCCLFCKSFITTENMRKFGCIEEKDLTSIVKAYNMNKELKDNEKYNYFDKIYEIFHSIIENNSIRYIKREKLIRIKRIKNKFKKNFKVLKFRDKTYNDYREYDISINEDLDEIEENLNNKIKQKIEEYNDYQEKVNRYIREEEEREYRHSLYSLKTCSQCKNKCYDCKINTKQNYRFGFVAHRDCLYNNNRCCICKEGPRTWELIMCEYCFRKRDFNRLNCIICKRY